MNARAVQIAILVLGVAVLIAFALFNQASPVSTYSTFDTGANGYQALFNVLRAEQVDVERLQQPLALRNPKTRVIAFTSTAPEALAGRAPVYDANDYKRLAAFAKSGGRLVYFASPRRDPMRAEIAKRKLPVAVLDAARFTNSALAKDPAAIRAAYDALAGHGTVAFDERLHGYAIDRTTWSVLPWPVRVAFWLVLLAIALALVESNVRFAPRLVREPPAERDSSAYIASMASLLRRARAGRAAIARFAKSAANDAELQELARLRRPDDSAVVRAAMLVSHHRKEGA